MPWTTPRVWTVAAINTAQMNEVSEQLAVLHKGNGHASLSTISPNASGQLNIGSVDQSFKVTESSNYGLKFVSATGREVGNTIHLMMTNASDIYTNTSTPPSGYLPIIVNGEQTFGSYNIVALQLITLVMYDGYWLCNIPVIA